MRDELVKYKKEMSDLSDFEKKEIDRLKREMENTDDPRKKDDLWQYICSYSAENIYEEDLNEEWNNFFDGLERFEPSLYLLLKYVAGNDGINGYHKVDRILCRAIEYLEREKELPNLEGEATIFRGQTFQIIFRDKKSFVLKLGDKEIEIQHLNKGIVGNIWKDRYKKNNWSITEVELDKFIKDNVEHNRSSIKNVKDFWREMKKNWGYNFLQKLEKNLNIVHKIDLEKFEESFLYKDSKSDLYWLIKP